MKAEAHRPRHAAASGSPPHDKWGDKATLGRTLKATSYANFLVNTVRATRNKEVDAQRTLREELAYVKRGENGEN